MPTYDYGCKACGHEFEREQRISDKPVKKCPECGKLQARRLISKTSFVLKGGGWYNDLYSSGKPDSGSSDKDGSAPAKSESAETSKDSTSDSKSESKPKSPSKKSSKKSSGGGKEAA